MLHPKQARTGIEPIGLDGWSPYSAPSRRVHRGLWALAAVVGLALICQADANAQTRNAPVRGQDQSAALQKLEREQRSLDQEYQQALARRDELLRNTEDLLNQQSQVEKSIPQLERELQKPLSQDEYTTKKCAVQDLSAKSEQIQKQINAGRQELAVVQQRVSGMQQRLESISQQISQARGPVTTRAQEPARPAVQTRRPTQPSTGPRSQAPAVDWQQAIAWQQQAMAAQQQAQIQMQMQRDRVRSDRLSQLMTTPVDPMKGMPSPLTQTSDVGRSTCQSLIARRTVAWFSVSFDGIATRAGDIFVEGPVSYEDSSRARTVKVSFTVSGNSADRTFHAGLYNSHLGGFFEVGSPTFSSGSGAVGTHSFNLSPGQFSQDVDSFMLQFMGSPTSGTQITVGNVVVEFYE